MIAETDRPKVLFMMEEFQGPLGGGSRSLSLLIKYFSHIEAVIISSSPALEEFGKKNHICVEKNHFFDVFFLENTAKKFRRSSLLNKWSILTKMLMSNFRAWRYLRKERFKAVHCNSIYDFLFVGFGVWISRIPLIFNIRGISTRNTLRWHWKFALLLSSCVIVLSEEMGHFYKNRIGFLLKFFVGDKIKVIYSGVDLDEVGMHSIEKKDSYRRQLGLNANAVSIGYVGRFDVRKGQLKFIQHVLPLLMRRIQNLQVVFVGSFRPYVQHDNLYSQECVKAVEALKFGDAVRFVGHQDNMGVWYSAFDLTVLTSTFEGLPRVFIESLAYGCPVVCTDVTSAREVFEKNQCGFVVLEDHYQDMADRIIKLIENQELRKQMGERGQETAKRLLDAPKIAKAYEELYLQTIERNKQK